MQGSKILGLVSLSVLGWVGCAADAPKPPPTAEMIAAAHVDIDAYLDLRHDAPEGTTATLVKRLDDEGFTAADVEAILKAGRASYPAPQFTPGTSASKFPIDCYNVAYSSTYYLTLPATYDAAVATPLIVVGHGGNSSMTQDEAESTARSYIAAYRKLSTGTPNAILVAPATTVGWSPAGDSLIESVISRVSRDYHVDPDRVYILGQSMGGHLSWRSAITYGDRFAAFSPQSGGYTSFIDNHQIQNLYTTHGYTTFGAVEPYDLTATNIALGDWLTANKFDWTIVLKDPGGHEIFSDELPKIGAFFAAHPRDLRRSDTYFSAGGAMQYTGNWEGQDYEILLNHPLKSNYHHWVEITPRPELMERLTFYAENKGGNVLELHTQNVRQARVLLHPSMVDFSKPVTIVVNGKQLFSKQVKPDLGQLLDRVREHDDRGRVFHAAVDLVIDTDEVVADPVGK